jgi:periplasmic glucans biosynthesis protein
MTRRHVDARVLCVWLTLILLGLGRPVHALTFDDIGKRAEQLAAAPYKKPASNLPKEVQGLSYDQYRDIRFMPAKALWRSTNLPFELMFFHQGWFFEQPVIINEVTASGVQELKFNPDDFDYGKNKIDRNALRGLGFAGFRVHYPVNTPAYRDETLVFLGASYFRALGRGQRYGLSARGLAIDTAVSTGEEFPRFVEFWIVRPRPTARELTIYALLDSPRATGAYRFTVTPGVSTTLDVDVKLYLREAIGKLGLAPLTSMFFFGANQHPARDDYRPQVHDSDGLAVHANSGEWLWRPLVNPKRLLVTSFGLTDPLGFGLMQRERWFGHYEDLEARYELRPSAWVEPKGAWGAGRVELVQIPVPDETNDNVVAYWVPAATLKPKEAYEFGYRILWQKDRETRPPLAWVAETRRGRGYARNPDDSIELHVDFTGPALKQLPADAPPAALVSVDGNGKIVEQHTVYNDVTGGWRVVVRVRRNDNGKPVELRAHLQNGSEVISETWSYILPPD